MTARWQDQFVDGDGRWLGMTTTYPSFSPESLGITPGGMITGACRRGYVCEFMIEDGKCLLNKLLIKMKTVLMDRGPVSIDDYPPINGVLPRQSYQYKNVALYENIGIETDCSIPKLLDMIRNPNSGKWWSFSNPFENEKPSKEGISKKKIKLNKREMLAQAQKSRDDSKTITHYYPLLHKTTLGYDIIGDVHGHATELENLLDKLGYFVDGSKGPKRRKIIFLGDFIDRGSENRKVIDIVKCLIRADRALAVMGNHEYNAICYHKKINGKYLRSHDTKNYNQHKNFLEEYPDEDEREKVINWFQKLPLFINLRDLRIVHACWDQEQIDFIEEQYGDELTDRFLEKSTHKRSAEYKAIETILKGPECPLKKGMMFEDSDGTLRNDVRIKWWQSNAKTLGEAAVIPDGAMTEHLNDPISDYCGAKQYGYPEDAPPVFFGHYSKLKDSECINSNTACLDFGIIDERKLACYRWHYTPVKQRAKKDFSLFVNCVLVTVP